MNKKVKPVTYSKELCFKCLKEKGNITTYSIGYRGYGSGFDNFNSIIQLCNDCNCEDLEVWCNEIPKETNYGEEYKYEDDIFDFIKTLPIQGRELFENQCSDGACAYYIDSQDWIDIELGIASDEVYKNNCMYSPSEVKAYEDRFPACKNVYIKTYRDGSSYSKCDYGAFGDENGNCGINISNKCFYCNKYNKKDFDYSISFNEKYINKSDLKKVNMYQYTCERCGEISYIHTYLEEFNCPKCYQYYELDDEN